MFKLPIDIAEVSTKKKIFQIMKILQKEETLLTNQDFRSILRAFPNNPQSPTFEKTLLHSLMQFFKSQNVNVDYNGLKLLKYFNLILISANLV
jgi:Ca2+-binding EF-hand superfamily protein